MRYCCTFQVAALGLKVVDEFVVNLFRNKKVVS